MAERSSEGVCKKIHNDTSPFRSTIRQLSLQPQGSISVTSDQKPLSQNTDYPVKTNLHQSKMIPIEFEPPGAQGKKVSRSFSPGIHSAGKENNYVKQPVQDSADSEIKIVKSHRFVGKSASRKREKPILASAPETTTPDENKQPNDVSFGKSKLKEDDDPRHESQFSDYIDKVKNRLIRTSSHLGRSDGPLANDKVNTRANPAKIKARTTANVGEGYQHLG